ncbi:MAG: PIN domain-containing protein [Bacteroidales bacterium]|nr:PIN domain-containing protein [Bacteroidales bacterium]
MQAGIIIGAMLMGLLAGVIAEKRGRKFFWWFVLGFLFGVIGVILELIFLKKKESKYYAIDTNVFMESPRFLDIVFKRDPRCVALISDHVMDELNHQKECAKQNGENEKLQKVQQAIKSINGYLQALSNAQGPRRASRLPQVLVVAVDRGLLKANGLSDDNDNMVLSAALAYKENNPVLITSDYGLQNIALGKGLKVLSLKEFTNNM